MPTLPRHAVHRLIAGVAGLALVVTGCGGGNGGGGTTTVPRNTVPVSTTTPPPGQAQLDSIVVQPGDLPTGWTAKSASPSPDPAADAAAIAQCVGATGSGGDQVAIAYSPDFVSGSTLIAATAASFKSPADVQADAAILVHPKASECLAQVGKARLVAGLPKGAIVKAYTVKVSPGSAGGPANVVASGTGTVTFSVAGHQTTLNYDVVFLIAPRVEANVEFFSQGKPISTQVKAAVVAKVAARMATSS